MPRSARPQPIAVVLLLSALASGCATQYGDAKGPLAAIGLSTGGYDERTGPGDLIKVSFYGNGYIKPEKVETYLLYRCAEIAIRENKPFFGFYKDLPQAVAQRTSTTKPTTHTMNRPYSYAYILPSTTPESGFLNARDIVQRHALEVLGKPTP